jgi:hypothetical protein
MAALRAAILFWALCPKQNFHEYILAITIAKIFAVKFCKNKYLFSI